MSRVLAFNDIDLRRWRNNLRKSQAATTYLQGRGLLKCSRRYCVGYEIGNSASKLNKRILFPLRDIDGTIVGVQGRAITSDIQPKYWHTPFPKGDKLKYLYGLYEIINGGTMGPITVLEGSPDVITLSRWGVRGVCVWGAVLGEYQAWLLKCFCSKVYISYDTDEAGNRATVHAERVLKDARLQYEIKQVPQDKAKDWCELYEQYGAEIAGREIARIFDL